MRSRPIPMFEHLSAPTMAFSPPSGARRDEALSNLERSSSSSTDEMSHREPLGAVVQRASLPDETPWTLSQVVRFVSWILSDTHVRTNNSHPAAASSHYGATRSSPPDATAVVVPPKTDRDLPTASCLFALASLLPSWSDLYIYAALSVSNETNEAAGRTDTGTTTLMSLLYDTIRLSDAQLKHNNQRRDDDDMVPSLSHQTCGALLSLATLWQALDRLQSHCELFSYSSLPKQHQADDVTVWWLQIPPNGNSTTWRDVLPSLVRASFAGLVIIQDQWQLIANKDEICSGATNALTGSLCSLKSSCVVILVQLLRHSQTEWLYDNHGVFVQKEEWARRLLQESSRLNDVHMPGSVFTVFSLHCLELLVALVEHGAPSSLLNEAMVDEVQRLLQTTSIVSHVIAAAFGVDRSEDETRSSPRWTRSSSTTASLRPQLLAVMRTLYRAGAVSMSETLSQHHCTRSFLEATWKAIISCALEGTSKQHQQTVSNDHLDCLLFLLSSCRTVTRNVAVEIIQKQQNGTRESTCGRLILTLLDWARRHSSIQASVLLQHLLMDRLHPLRHDEFSRLFWPSRDTTASTTEHDNLLLEQFMSFVTELASSSHLSLMGNRRPILLSLLDALYVLFLGDIRHTQRALSVQSVEALIQMMSPKRIHVHANTSVIDLNQSHESIGDSGTPTAHNLSRLDSSMLLEEEETQPARGIDLPIRLAAATLLALLANCHGYEPDSDIIVLRSRTIRAVHSFIEQLVMGSITFANDAVTRSSTEATTLDVERRRLRLLVAFHAPDNEDNIASLIHSADVLRQQSTRILLSSLERCQQTIDANRVKEKQLEEEQRACVLRSTAQAVASDRQHSIWRHLVERQAKELVETHSNERQNSEAHATLLARRLVDAEKAAHDARDMEQQTRVSLESLTSQLNAASTREQALACRLERSEREAQQLAEDLRVAKIKGQGAHTREKELKDQVSEQADVLEQLEQSVSELRESLESLFGDMVSLTQMYIVKEKEEEANRVGHESLLEKARHCLEAERQRNAKLEERDKRNQYEVEVLSKNYTKAREKLAKERDDRKREADQRRRRAGPISYINQLHTNASVEDKESKENRTSASSSFASSRSKPPSSR